MTHERPTTAQDLASIGIILESAATLLVSTAPMRVRALRKIIREANSLLDEKLRVYKGGG